MNYFQEAIRRTVLVMVSGLCLFGIYKGWQEGIIKMGFDGHRAALESPEY